MAVITGTDGNDRYNDPSYPGNVELKGTHLADRMYGLAGDDELVGFDGDDVLEGGAGSDVLWGQYGFDTASYQGSPLGVQVSLTSEYGAYGGDAAGDRLYSIEGAVGSAYGDLLWGNDGDNVLRGGGGDDTLVDNWGNDVLYGEAGNDLIGGGAGNDRLDGGDGDDLMAGGDGADVLEGRGGADRFVYDQTYESLPAAPDLILDFSRKQGDKIDLSGVDANEQATGDQVFKFVGQDAFTAAGQVRFFKAGGDTVVEVNTDDTAPGAEMRIEIDPLVNFQAIDFVL